MGQKQSAAFSYAEAVAFLHSRALEKYRNNAVGKMDKYIDPVCIREMVIYPWVYIVFSFDGFQA